MDVFWFKYAFPYVTGLCQEKVGDFLVLDPPQKNKQKRTAKIAWLFSAPQDAEFIEENPSTRSIVVDTNRMFPHRMFPATPGNFEDFEAKGMEVGLVGRWWALLQMQWFLGSSRSF